MAIHFTFNTEELSSSDIALLGALARSLADPAWYEQAEKALADKGKRGPGRPRKTDEEREAEALEKANAAAKAKDAAEAAAAEKAALKKSEAKKPAAPKAEEAPEAEAEEAPEAEAEEAPEAPEAEAEEAPEAEAEQPASGEDPKAEAIRLATALVHDGRGAEARAALGEVGAKKVGELKGDALEGFLKIVRGL